MQYKIKLYTSNNVMPYRSAIWHRAYVNMQDKQLVIVTKPLIGTSKTINLPFANIDNFLYGQGSINIQHSDKSLPKIIVLNGRKAFTLAKEMQATGLKPYKPISSNSRKKDYAIYSLIAFAMLLVIFMAIVSNK